MLRITLEENPEQIVLKLEGRLAGPWVVELDRLWEQTSSQRGNRGIVLDLRPTTFADEAGVSSLRKIYAETGAGILSGNPWTQHLADKIQRVDQSPNEEV